MEAASSSSHSVEDKMEHGEFTVSDGTPIFYRRSAGTPGTPLPTLVLIHGWSGSGRFFDPCIEHLISEGIPLLVPDLRFHGKSGKPAHGMHVARLAADVRELMIGLDVRGAVMVGTSMGCAVAWCLHELFGLKASGLAAGCVFVDQAPLQNRVEGWDLGSNGCYDAATLAALQATLKRSVAEIAAGNAAGCLSKPVPAETLELLTAETMLCDGEQLGTLMADHTQVVCVRATETMLCDGEQLGTLMADHTQVVCARATETMLCDGEQLGTLMADHTQAVCVRAAETMLCDGEQLGTLMADHTQLDHRATLPTIDVPCLSLCGGDSGCFPVEGLRAVARLVPTCNEDVWDGCNHWLYIEEPRRFAAALLDFARSL
ncbi:hypothetical protein FOA52_009679 [Chlamydomonas sp. UWO 241]|nr:hypothetical protein FOA52_009679 [Chlamydomonas sp. UWO 241]